jgi:hypothetical protein
MKVKEAISQSFVKVYNFIQREFAYSGQIDLSGKYIPFGVTDNFPQQLNDMVMNSPTATSCLSTTADFIAGEGFNLGEDIETIKINSQGLTFHQFHIVQSASLAHHWGIATIVKYNKAGQKTQLFDIPFGYCRLGQPDDKGIISKIHYNPYFGTALYRSQDTEVYDVYNPDAAPVQAANSKWKGQIYWMGIRDNKDPFYPVPDHYSAAPWMRVEKNAAVYFDENLENGFLTPTILKLYGDPNDPSGLKDAEGNDIPKGVAFDKEMTKNFAGAKRVGQIMTFWASNKEEFPSTEAFPSNANAEMHRVTDEHAIKKITIATKVPSILANISEGVSLGGDGNTIRAAVKLMQQRVKRPQQILLDYYQNLLTNFVGYIVTEPLSIVPYNPFPEMESVDPQIWEVLKPEEKRQWVKDHTEIELIEETAPAEPAEPVQPVENRIVNLHFNSYPSKAKENIKRALEWQDKFNIGCIKPKGRELSEYILKGMPLGPKEIKRLSRYLSKETIHKDKPYDKSCESLLYDAWGGSEMMVWANDKVKELNGQAD